MSDGALSQDEIDALLAGVDSAGLSSMGGLGDLGGGAPAAASSGGGSEETRAFEDFLSANVGAGSSNLSMMTGAPVVLSGPAVTFTDRDAFLGLLPDMVTVVKTDFSSGFPGEHLFIMPEETARSIASLMNKEENIQMDEMAMSVIGEVVSQLVGTQIPDLTNRTSNKSIAAIAPQAANVKKATAGLPAGDFLSAVYQLELGDGNSHQMWEVYGGSVAAEIARALSGGASAPMPGMGMPGMGGMPMQGMGMPGMGMPGMGMQGMGAGMPGMGMPGMGAGMPGMGMPGMGGMQMQGMGMPGMGMQGMGMPVMSAPTNVQAVQFPNLMPHTSVQEAGNISLIMDVFMEMTVELGRTRKLIKEILSMGEGTIIELDKLAGEPVDILVNHKLIAKGEVVVIDENFGVRVTEIVSPLERMNEMG
jgi:flagellar motor switch protein FliN/FliY